MGGLGSKTILKTNINIKKKVHKITVLVSLLACELWCLVTELKPPRLPTRPWQVYVTDARRFDSQCAADEPVPQRQRSRQDRKERDSLG